MEIEAKKCTLGKRKGSNQHRFVDCCLLSFPRFVHPTVYITIKGLYTLYFKIHHWVDKMVVWWKTSFVFLVISTFASNRGVLNTNIIWQMTKIAQMSASTHNMYSS